MLIHTHTRTNIHRPSAQAAQHTGMMTPRPENQHTPARLELQACRPLLALTLAAKTWPLQLLCLTDSQSTTGCPMEQQRTRNLQHNAHTHTSPASASCQVNTSNKGTRNDASGCAEPTVTVKCTHNLEGWLPGGHCLGAHRGSQQGAQQVARAEEDHTVCLTVSDECHS